MDVVAPGICYVFFIVEVIDRARLESIVGRNFTSIIAYGNKPISIRLWIAHIIWRVDYVSFKLGEPLLPNFFFYFFFVEAFSAAVEEYYNRDPNKNSYRDEEGDIIFLAVHSFITGTRFNNLFLSSHLVLSFEMAVMTALVINALLVDFTKLHIVSYISYGSPCRRIKLLSIPRVDWVRLFNILLILFVIGRRSKLTLILLH